MPPKRGRRAASEPELEEKSKKLQQCVDNVAEEFLCPITFELPVDPVMADDGRVYERRAIEEWIARPGDLKSPALNTPMEPRLLPATQVRNMIEQMVRTGAISGPKADAWSKKLKDEEKAKETRARAEGGDVEAVILMAEWYGDGSKGLAKDEKEALVWWRRGHDLGDPWCTSSLGSCYEDGDGVEVDKAYAVHLYTAAACRGSKYACACLAKCFEEGACGLQPNKREATRWLREIERAEVADLGASSWPCGCTGQ